ncbi:MAG: helicase-related protein [Nanopusillaceae archaeon]
MHIELREYQKNILKSCLLDNTLVILPTGTGKTLIAFFVMIERLREFPDKKIYFLAPTKPLVNQHYNNFIKFFPEYKDISICITGEIHPYRREYLYKQANIIFITPQTLQNDLLNGKVTFYNASTIIFDEAHRAVKKYAYSFIAKKFFEQSPNPRIIGLTASPGWNIDRIQEIINNLYIKNVEIRTGKEEDIVKYMKPINIEKIEVELDSEFLQIENLLKQAIDFRVEKIKNVISDFSIRKGKKDVLEWIDTIKKQINLDPLNNGLKQSFLLASEILKIMHALEVLETQTIYTFLEYFTSIDKSLRKSRADYNVLEDIRIKKAIYLAKKLLEAGKDHPKLKKLLELIKENKDKKIIVFAQIRKTLDRIKDILDKEGFISEKFIGKKEMGQSEQIRVLKNFSEGNFNILLATSIGEEGIDIPKVDIVIFYEPVPSEIRYIQRRGRTGRGEIGKVYILVTKNSIDEKFYWVAVNKERKMFKLIKHIRKYLKSPAMDINKNPNKLEIKKEETLKDIKEYILKSEKKEDTNLDVNTIVADYKEKDSGVLQILSERDLLIKLENLEIGDYIIGNYIIERKTILDFISSIADGRLNDQLSKLKDKNSILILEGDEEDFYIAPEISSNYIKSLILKIILEYKIPILRTKNFIETSNYLYILAKNINKFPSIPEFTKEYDENKIRENILKQIPGIGDQLAKKLLERFKSIKNIILAKKVEIENIIGESKAERLKKIFEEEYKSEK